MRVRLNREPKPGLFRRLRDRWFRALRMLVSEELNDEMITASTVVGAIFLGFFFLGVLVAKFI